MFALLALVGLAVLTLGGVLGCDRPRTADLLDVVDVAPRHLEVGDTVEVLGSDLPSGNVQYASVELSGTLHRAGAEPVALDGLVVEGASPSPDRVSFTFTEELQRRICGEGDEAMHTTFVGDVIVRFEASNETGPGVRGTVREVVLDVRGPPVRRALAAQRRARGEQALAFLGLTLTPRPHAAEGMRVAAVEPDSPAARAGLRVDDVLVRFASVTVLTPADVVPERGARVASALIRRGGDEHALRIDVTGFDDEPVPTAMLAALVILGVLGAFLLLAISPAGRMLPWLERRLTAHVSTRKGRRGGVSGTLALLWSLIRRRADRVPSLAPYLVFVVVTASFVLMPLGKRLLSAELDVGVLYVIALSSLVVMGLLTGAGATPRWSPWGALRAALQLLASQLPALTAVVCVVMVAGSLRMEDVITAQTGVGHDWLGRGGWPWFWLVFRHPGNLILFVLFFTTATLEGQRDELPGAEGETGVRSSFRTLLFVFADWLHVFVCCGLATALFLGGWLVPGVSPDTMEGHLGWQIAGTALFLIKSWAVVLTVVAVRRTLPRLRADQLMRMTWRWLVPLGALGAGLCALWMAGSAPGEEGTATLPAAVRTAIGIFTFALCALLGLHVLARLRHHLSQRPALHLNPFL